MNIDEYRDAYYAKPQPVSRYDFSGTFGITLCFKAFEEAVQYYTTVLGPPAYAEKNEARGWRISSGWLTVLPSASGSPTNMELVLEMNSPAEAERLQRDFIEAGGEGPPPSDQLMYEAIRMCPVRDPFGTDILIFSRLNN